MKLKETVLLSIIGLTVILNGALMALLELPTVLDELRVVASVAFAIGCALVILFIVALPSKGTEAVIDSGIYGVVRHPMYLGGIFFYVYMIIWAQHWITAILAIVGMVCIYLTMKIEEEERCVKKFGCLQTVCAIYAAGQSCGRDHTAAATQKERMKGNQHRAYGHARHLAKREDVMRHITRWSKSRDTRGVEE